MKTILVTGAGGLLGLHLVKILRRRRDINLKIFDRRKHSLEKPEILSNLVKNCEVIFHLAAVNSPNDPDVFKVNVLGTSNLLDALVINKVNCQIIFPSTFGVYKTPVSGQKIDENFEVYPRNRYGISKFLSEELIRLYSGDSIKSRILRISNVYGPGDRPGRSAVANFFEKIKKGEAIEVYGNGLQTRDFIYLDDVVRAMINSMDAGLKNNVVTLNVCSGEETSINKLIEFIEKICNKTVKIKYKEPNKSGLGYWRGDNNKAKKLLNWAPKISLEKGLKLLSSSL